MSKRVDEIMEVEMADDNADFTLPGYRIQKAPQPALTAADATSITTSGGTGTHIDSTAQPVLDNMRTRINEIEEALRSLGLIK